MSEDEDRSELRLALSPLFETPLVRRSVPRPHGPAAAGGDGHRLDLAVATAAARGIRQRRPLIERQRKSKVLI